MQRGAFVWWEAVIGVHFMENFVGQVTALPKVGEPVALNVTTVAATVLHRSVTISTSYVHVLRKF